MPPYHRPVPCALCEEPLEDPDLAASYPNLVCRTCDQRAVNLQGKTPAHFSMLDDGDNPVMIDGLKCWRSYRFSTWVTMRDSFDCQTLDEFNARHLPQQRPGSSRAKRPRR